jgi:iron uptake system EfeUOB component EfeO/EfeM
MLSRGVLLAPLAVAVLVAGCGGGSSDTPAATARPAPPVSAKDPTAGIHPPVKPAQYAAPIATYRRHVQRELTAMLQDVGALRAATAADDLAAARRAWLRADARYETIGAAYGAFGDLDAAINGGPAGLPGGVHAADFTGLHRVELALWGRHSTRDARPYADRLDRDVRRLRTAVAGRLDIEPLEYSLRAHEVLEDSLHLQLSGRASPWASDALVALDSNIAGTRVVLRSLDGLLKPRNPVMVHEADRALDTLQRALDRLRGRDGSLPRWDALGQRRREQIDGLTAAAAEQLAYVPELIDPRPPRPQVASSAGGTQ